MHWTQHQFLPCVQNFKVISNNIDLWFWKTFLAPSLFYPSTTRPPTFLPVHNGFYPSKWRVDGFLHKAMHQTASDLLTPDDVPLPDERVSYRTSIVQVVLNFYEDMWSVEYRIMMFLCGVASELSSFDRWQSVFFCVFVLVSFWLVMSTQQIIVGFYQ